MHFCTIHFHDKQRSNSVERSQSVSRSVQLRDTTHDRMDYFPFF